MSPPLRALLLLAAGCLASVACTNSLLAVEAHDYVGSLINLAHHQDASNVTFFINCQEGQQPPCKVGANVLQLSITNMDGPMKFVSSRRSPPLTLVLPGLDTTNLELIVPGVNTWSWGPAADDTIWLAPTTAFIVAPGATLILQFEFVNSYSRLPFVGSSFVTYYPESGPMSEYTMPFILDYLVARQLTQAVAFAFEGDNVVPVNSSDAKLTITLTNRDQQNPLVIGGLLDDVAYFSVTGLWGQGGGCEVPATAAAGFVPLMPAYSASTMSVANSPANNPSWGLEFVHGDEPSYKLSAPTAVVLQPGATVAFQFSPVIASCAQGNSYLDVSWERILGYHLGSVRMTIRLL